MHSNLTLRGTRDTERLAAAIAPHLAAGDFVGLVGGLGAGKSVFARALVGARLASQGRTESVPSPTYTLVQVYHLGSVELWHADLYRIGAPGEIEELGLLDALDTAICVVEWSDRLGPSMPAPCAHPHPGLRRRRRRGDKGATLEARGPAWDWLGPALAAVG